MSILCINAFIYAAKYGEFQQGVRRLITELRERLNRQQTEVEMHVEMEDIQGTQRGVEGARPDDPTVPLVDK